MFRKLRMVPVLLNSFTTRAKEKISKLIAIQKSYTSRLDTAQCYNFNNIDIVRDSIKKSMRQIVMELRTLNGIDQLVFTSIDYKDYSESHKLTFPKALKSHAYDYMAQLPTFLRWTYGEDIYKLFTDAAVEKAIEAPWSKGDMCTISKQEMDLDTFAEDMRNHAWKADCGQEISAEVIIIDDIEHVRKTEEFLFKRATDDGSVSTFNHRKENKHSNHDENSVQDDSPNKKLQLQSISTNDEEMNTVHTPEILLTSKEQEMLSLRQRLGALTASKG